MLDAVEPWVVRPRDLTDVWARPAKELVRLADHGLVKRVAHGYWAIVPPARRLDGGWVPPIEELALALATRDAVYEGAVLSNMAAARVHGLVPRALGAAVVAVDRQRPPIRTPWGTIYFTTRNTATLDVQATVIGRTEGLVTTPEQTLIDLLRHPTVGHVVAADAREAATKLARDVDWDQVEELAGRQRGQAALTRFRRDFAEGHVI
ncbi:hypothetical protein BH24ACT15_BH24ACT15_33320 [soil metagenome]